MKIRVTRQEHQVSSGLLGVKTLLGLGSDVGRIPYPALVMKGTGLELSFWFHSRSHQRNMTRLSPRVHPMGSTKSSKRLGSWASNGLAGTQGSSSPSGQKVSSNTSLSLVSQDETPGVSPS